jgi:hypothetical protein
MAGGRAGGRRRCDLPVCQGSQSPGFKDVKAREGGVLESFQEGRARVEGRRQTSKAIQKVGEALWGGGEEGGREGNVYIDR